VGLYSVIVVGADGSPTSDIAVAEAVELASKHRAKLRVVHVTPEVKESVDFYSIQEVKEALHDEGREILGKACSLADTKGVEVVGHIVAGEPEDKLVSFADEYDADLIVMGSHGHSGIVKLLMGSVTEKVVSHAHCSVLVVRHRRA
jgi:nucleotide-binding universal stress UspA family protein